MSTKPTTEQGAYENGKVCFEAGHNIHYNPYRNMSNDTTHLYVAWKKGWQEKAAEQQKA